MQTVIGKPKRYIFNIFWKFGIRFYYRHGDIGQVHFSVICKWAYRTMFDTAANPKYEETKLDLKLSLAVPLYLIPLRQNNIRQFKPVENDPLYNFQTIVKFS